MDLLYPSILMWYGDETCWPILPVIIQAVKFLGPLSFCFFGNGLLPPVSVVLISGGVYRGGKEVSEKEGIVVISHLSFLVIRFLVIRSQLALAGTEEDTLRRFLTGGLNAHGCR
ncbi:MAG: hypothetical protein CMM01_08030 [Rhodopirellula sp.]|nr:hypothetical protein [Rhodopirellula sp.]OUX51650.1 MAG: hypothetical protein CBE43_03000 [Rhodopirellula sp. TMED283]